MSSESNALSMACSVEIDQGVSCQSIDPEAETGRFHQKWKLKRFPAALSERSHENDRWERLSSKILQTNVKDTQKKIIVSSKLIIYEIIA